MSQFGAKSSCGEIIVRRNHRAETVAEAVVHQSDSLKKADIDFFAIYKMIPHPTAIAMAVAIITGKVDSWSYSKEKFIVDLRYPLSGILFPIEPSE